MDYVRRDARGIPDTEPKGGNVMKNLFPALMEELMCAPDQFSLVDTQTVLRDLATLKDMAVREYADNGRYVSNICEIEAEYQREALRRLGA